MAGLITQIIRRSSSKTTSGRKAVIFLLRPIRGSRRGDLFPEVVSTSRFSGWPGHAVVTATASNRIYKSMRNGWRACVVPDASTFFSAVAE